MRIGWLAHTVEGKAYLRESNVVGGARTAVTVHALISVNCTLETR